MKNTGKNYDWQGMVVVTVLMIVGFLIIYYGWGNNEVTYENFYNYIYRDGMLFIVALLFVGVGFYCWIMFVNNVMIKPKKEILYLKNIDDSVLFFLDKKGRKHSFANFKKNNYSLGKFYLVSKTRNVVKEIISLSDGKFDIPKEKVSYWLNWYSPVGNFENLFLLPIVYLILVPGLLSFLMANSFDKIYGLIIMIVPVILIIYDAIYKMKKFKLVRSIEELEDLNYKNEELRKVNEMQELVDVRTKFLRFFTIFSIIIQVVVGMIFVYFCVWIFIKSSDVITRVAIVPFYICSLAIFLKAVFNIVNLFNERFASFDLSIIFEKMYLVGFLLFWFGFLFVFCYFVINDKNYGMLFFSIPFWVVGIYLIYTLFKSK